MQIGKFIQDLHMPVLEQWHDRRNQKWRPDGDWYPERGLMCYSDEGMPLAAVFMWVDASSKKAYIDEFECNPSNTHDVNVECGRVLLERLSVDAKALGCKWLSISSLIPSIITELKSRNVKWIPNQTTFFITL